MGSVEWRFSDVIHAPPDAVYGWLSDFREDDHARPAFKRGAGVEASDRRPSKRTVLSQNGRVIRIEDTWGRQKHTSTVTLDPGTHSIRIQGGMGYDSTWRAIEDAAGTLLEVEGKMGRGLVGSIMTLFAGRIRKGMEDDFRGHAEDLREALATRKSS